MLQLEIPDVEIYDEANRTFSIRKGKVLRVEHSLVSLSKWEAKYCKPFLSDDNKTFSETVNYIKFMTVTPNIDSSVYANVDGEVIKKVNAYIMASMTATTFKRGQQHKINKDIVTSEVIYYWMITLGIPFECQKWHLNRLLTLINVCNIKNQPKKKMTKAAAFAQQRELNAMRRDRLGTRG